jgi:hypothetical protein
MKNIIVFLFIIVLMSCSTKNEKIVGVVAKFDPAVYVTDLVYRVPRVDFTDGRYFFFDKMPDKPMDKNSEIELYYNDRNGNLLYLDSVRVVEPVRSIPVLENSQMIHHQSSKDFEALVKLVTTKGTKVSSSDYEYIHYDASVNRHDLIAIRRMDGRADPTAPVSQISAWVKKRLARDNSIMYGYVIKPQGIEYDNPSDTLAIKEVIKDLLVIAKE